MENFDITVIILAFLGMTTHVLMKVSERDNKSEPCSFKRFFSSSMNWVRIGLTIVSTIALILMTNDIGDMMGIRLSDGSPARGILSFGAGYLNHSLIRNVLKVFQKK